MQEDKEKELKALQGDAKRTLNILVELIQRGDSKQIEYLIKDMPVQTNTEGLFSN